MAEYIFDAQVNAGWGLTLNMTGKSPEVAKRIFATYADALDYVNDFDDSAIPGLQLSVINDADGTKNGIYFVSKIGTKAADGSRANDGVLVKDTGFDPVSVNTYAEALTKIKVDATTQEVKNLGQIIYVKTATGTVDAEDYKAAGAYIVTGAASLEKLGTTSASGDFTADIANLRTDLGTLSITVDGIEETVNNIKDVKIPEVEEDIKEVSDAFDIFAGEYNTYKTEVLDPTAEMVNNHTTELSKVVKTISAGGNTIKPVSGVATITYDSQLNENSTNAPQTKVVLTAFNMAQNAAVDSYKKSKLSILTPDTIGDTSVLKRYVFYQGRDAQDPTNTPGTVVGTIDIPKDLVVTSGELVIGDGNNGTDLGTQYLKLNIGNGEPVYIKVGDLVDAYVEGDYLSIGEGNELSVDIDAVDAKLAEDASAVGSRIKAVEEDIANVVSHTDEELGKLVVAEGTKTLSTLVKDNKDAIATLTASGFANGTINSTIVKITDTLLEGGGPDGENGGLYTVGRKALSAVQEVKSSNESQLTASVEDDVVTLTPVVAVLADLENGTNGDKLLTAGVAKQYIDNQWDWEVIEL